MIVVDIVSVCSLVVAIAGLIGTILATIKKGKKAKILEILSRINQYVIEAEGLFGKGNGQAKLEWVITKINIDCALANVEISREDITEVIEETLDTPQRTKNNEIQE